MRFLVQITQGESSKYLIISIFIVSVYQGTCQDSNGDSPSGVTPFPAIKEKEQCLKTCSEWKNRTGCQYVSPGLSSISCWVFTGEVAKGSEKSGEEAFTCWTFPASEIKGKKK